LHGPKNADFNFIVQNTVLESHPSDYGQMAIDVPIAECRIS